MIFLIILIFLNHCLIFQEAIAFSCGTAMPFFVSHQNLGYIISQTQGGGECAISQIALPNDQVVCYSSIHVYTIVVSPEILIGASPCFLTGVYHPIPLYFYRA